MTIPREFIQELLTRIEIIDLIDGRLPLRKKSNNNYFACCPFHTEKSASFSVSQQKQFYYCFGCGAHGNAIDFLMQYDHLNFKEAVAALAQLAGIEVPKSDSTTSSEPIIDQGIYELLDAVANQYKQQLRKHPKAIQYLKQRGISGEMAKEFCIGFAPAGWEYLLQTFGKTAALKQQLFAAGLLIKKDDGSFYDRFRERIMFPIQDRRGRVIGFGGRTIDQTEPKYLNSPETTLFQKGHELYGLYQTLTIHRQLQKVLIVEGYLDVIALFQYQITYALATLGTATTAAHLKRLSRYTSEIIFCFDGDLAGRTAAWRALLVFLPLMRDDLQIKFMFLPDGEDPDSLVRKEGAAFFAEKIKEAWTFSHFFFHHMMELADLTHLDGRARFIKLATTHLNQLPEGGVFKQMMFEELARKTRTHVDQLLQKSPKSSNYPRKFIKIRSPSPLRLAMSLLLQEPSLVKILDKPLPLLDTPGLATFVELIDIIKKNNVTTPAALREYWRDHPLQKTFAKLAQMEHVISEKGLTHEFKGAISHLHKMSQEKNIESLLTKAASKGLSFDEKKQLNDLIHAKNKVSSATDE